MERYLGYKRNQAGISAIEKTYDSDRRRNIDVAEIVAFAHCFNLPIGWFFLPAPGHGADRLEPVVDNPLLFCCLRLPVAGSTPTSTT